MGGKSNLRKRTKTQASPDSVSDSTVKRPTVNRFESLSGLSDTDITITSDKTQKSESFSNSQLVTTSDIMASPLSQSQSILQHIPPYCGPFYPYPQSPYPQFATNSSPQSATQTVSQQTQQPSFQQSVLDKLESIGKQLSSVSQKMTDLDKRVSSLENTALGNSRKLIEIDASRAHDSKVCDELLSKQLSIEQSIKQHSDRVSEMSKSYEHLKRENSALNDMIVDLQARSMRDNLLFFGVEECATAPERRDEDCILKILNFCTEQLGLPDAHENFKIDRAHRLGRFRDGATRPIVAKFCFFQDKLTVRKKAYEQLKNTNFRVSDQYPQAVREKRKVLRPFLEKAKQDGKSAVLSFDKLIINGKPFTVDTISTYKSG